MYKNGHRKVFGSTVYSVIREMLSKGGQKENRIYSNFLIKKKTLLCTFIITPSSAMSQRLSSSSR